MRLPDLAICAQLLDILHLLAVHREDDVARADAGHGGADHISTTRLPSVSAERCSCGESGRTATPGGRR